MSGSPIDTSTLYCDHGLPAGRECWRCWQRLALDAEADRQALVEALRDIQGKIMFSECAYCREGFRLADEALKGAP